jgi:CARDB
VKRWLFLIVVLIRCSQPLRAVPYCCTVTAVDARTGTASAVETATGRTFEFHIPNLKLFATVRVGTPVYANFSTKQVSLDGKTPCGEITKIDPAPPRGGVGAVAKVTPPASAAPPSPVPTAAPAADPGSHSSLARGPTGKRPSAPAQMGPVVSAQGCPAGSAAPDLLITALGFDAERRVTYTVANCGQVTTQQPFIVDLYLNAIRGDTVEHQPLPAKSQQSVTSQLARYPGCDRIQLRAVADPQDIVAEANENNNERTLDTLPPCPDLVVQEIKQDWEDANTRYRVQIKIGNIGTGPSQIPVYARVHITGTVSIPDQVTQEIPPLAPGQSYIFHAPGKHLGTSSIDVDIFVDSLKQLVESNEDNNIAHKTLGPH